MSKSLLDNMHIRKIKSTCDKKDNCPYVKFYEDVMNVITAHTEDIDDKLHEQKKDIRDVENKLHAANVIKRLYHFIAMNESYFELPSELFDKETFVLRYMEKRTIYDAEYLAYIIDIEETYERKAQLEHSIDDTKKKIDTLSDTKEMYNHMTAEIEQLSSSISDIDAMIEHQRKDFDYNTEKVQELESVQNEIKQQMEFLQELEELRKEFNQIKTELSSMESKMNSISQAREQYDDYERKKSEIERKIRETEIHLRNTQVTISSITDLQREQRQLIEKYTKDKLILDAVSPTTGIPLDFINYYIKEEMINKVNELLDTVYHGRLRLLKSKTVINENEFTIPYTKRGTVVADINKASDGEKAIISLAFSLVLLNITEGPYNILLLDEMDTTLDTESRAKYIELLEQFMKTIKAEQLFLISHNSMFDVYPVNLILTSQSSISKTENSQIIDLTI